MYIAEWNIIRPLQQYCSLLRVANSWSV